MTRKEAIKQAIQLFNSSIDLEENEAKQDWIEMMADVIQEDSYTKNRLNNSEVL